MPRIVEIEYELWNEFKFLVLSGPIDYDYWHKRFGFGKCRKGLNGYLKRRGITYTTTREFPLTIKDLDRLVELYTAGETLQDLMKVFNLSFGKIRKYLIGRGIKIRAVSDYSITSKIKENLSIENTPFSVAFEKAKALNLKPKIDTTKKYGEVMSVCCETCGTYIKFSPQRFMKFIERNGKLSCKKCYYEIDYYNKPTKLSFSRNNKTGFMGISIYLTRSRDGSKRPFGFTVQLNYKNKLVLSKRFQDPLLTEKTKLKAAIYREYFIIKNTLPSYRNFTDEEFKENFKLLKDDFTFAQSLEEDPIIDSIVIKEGNRLDLTDSIESSEFDKYFV